MSMSRKDFEAIAEILNGGYRLAMGDRVHRTMVNEFAEYLATTNPQFDRESFVKACGIDVAAQPRYGVSYTDSPSVDDVNTREHPRIVQCGGCYEHYPYTERPCEGWSMDWGTTPPNCS